MFDWNDLRHFLAVARTGSTLAASKSLRVSQTTTARRIAALEAALRLTLFERLSSGYALTAAGEAMRSHAERVEQAALALDDVAAAQSRGASGTVRLTAIDIHAVTVLPPILQALRAVHPDIMIELDASSHMRDLAAGAADVALRSSVAPTGRGLVGRRITDDKWSLYCSRAYAARHSQPRTRVDLRAHPFIGGGGDHVWLRYETWLRQHDLEASVVMHHATPVGLLAAVRAGSGLAVLPCFVADPDPDLVRCLAPVANAASGLWLLTHERVRHEPRVRAVVDFLADRLAELARMERTEPPNPWKGEA